jgi:hypothetical protein
MYTITFLSKTFVLQNLCASYGPENTLPTIIYEMNNECRVVGGKRICRGNQGACQY